MKVEISDHVLDFVRRLAPDPRRRLREALPALQHERGDIEPLESELTGFYRLRVRGYRMIFWYQVVRGERVIRVEFAERRPLVYELFEAIAHHLQP